MAGKWVLAFLAAGTLSAEQISIGVFGLFRPDVLLAQCGSTGPRSRIEGRLSCFAEAGLLLEVPGRISRRFSGRLSVTKANGVLSPVFTMDLEEAVAAVVAAEMPGNVPPEALKALAVAARSVYLAGPRRHAGFDFCDTTHCQVHGERPPPDHPARRAARDTAGLVATYRGRPFAPMYSRSCGGHTFRAEDVGLSADPYPFHSVACERCIREEPEWSRTLTTEQAAAFAGARSERARVALTRKLGWTALPGNNYRARQTGAGVAITGRGYGHGVGLCQRGIAAMAAAGADFRSILRHYLPDTELGSWR